MNGAPGKQCNGLHRPGRVRGWLPACLLLMLALWLPAPHATAADEVPVVQYEVEIVAPFELARTLRQDLDLVRWRLYPGMNRDLLDRLVAEAKVQLTDALAAEGYFSAAVTPTVTGDVAPWTARFAIDPGPATTISEIRIGLTGELAEEPDRTELERKRILDRWPLPEGARFRQADWDLAKRRAVAEVTNSRFAGARLAASKATIDPQTHTAVLEIDIDSGPVFRFGELQIRGLVRYREDVVRNLATFKPGERFDEDKLLLYQRRLMVTGFFSAVQVELDNDPANAAAAPVRVSVLEGNSRRIEIGGGYSTDTLYRAQLAYSDNDFRGLGWRWRNDARIESRAGRASSTMTLPARADGWQDAYALRYTQSDVSGLDQREGSFTFSRTAVDERSQPQWTLSTHLQRQVPEGVPGDTVHALFGAFRYTRRATDDLLSPTRGFIYSLQVGAAPPGVSTRTFVRGVGQAALWIPVGRSNTLVLRGEAGAIGARSSDGIPESFLFRTGGDTSIRGYAFESIGVTQGAATVGGKLFALANIEAVHWVTETWGVAAFYDAGNAADRVADMKPLAQGAGFGARLRTPLGPVRIDLAYGERTREVRLHLSLGVIF
jgi:translocation and assembly module TamA